MNPEQITPTSKYSANPDNAIPVTEQELAEYPGAELPAPRLTLDDLLMQKRPLGDTEVDGLDGVYVKSGKIDGTEPGEILTGGVYLRATRVFSQTLGSAWRWKAIEGSPEPWNAQEVPCWDGIHDGDEITVGHLWQLRADGVVKA